MLRYTSTTHKIVAILSFLILSTVQFFLLYKTYEHEDEHYFLAETQDFKAAYEHSIVGDKVTPGGQAILDHYLNGNMSRLEDLYYHHHESFDSVAQRVCDSAFRALRQSQTIDTLLAHTIRHYHLTRSYRYALLINYLYIAFKSDENIPLYLPGHHYAFIDPSFQTDNGALISGNLRTVDAANATSGFGVSSRLDHSTSIFFSLHVDVPDRRWLILIHMMPTFLLSLFSVLMVVLLFFITFRNWMKQKKLSEMKSDFINSITHEFHTPLSAIIVANKTMQKDQILSDKESLRPLTEVVQRQADRLKVLIGQVLDITNLNKITLKKEQYSLQHLLDEILLDYRLKLTGNNVRLEIQNGSETDNVWLDRFWFTTILQNIFDNAIKYNNNHDKEITVVTFEDKKALYISISDNGIGMKEETRKHVFEKFYRHVQPLDNGSRGLGLGLFYVKQAIDAHSWRIAIESRPGVGSTFTIIIPL